MALDQSQEHSIKLLKEDSGAKGLYGQQEEKEIIELSRPEVLRVIHEFEQAIHLSTDKDSIEHPESASAEQRKFLKDLNSMLSLVEEGKVINPYKEIKELITLTTGEIMDPEIANCLRDARMIG